MRYWRKAGRNLLSTMDLFHCCELDDRAACRRSGETGSDEEDVRVCDKSSSGSATFDTGAEHHLKGTAKSPALGSSVGHLPTLRHPGTVSGLGRPGVSPNDGLTTTEVNISPRRGDVDSFSTTSMSSGGGESTAPRSSRFSNIDVFIFISFYLYTQPHDPIPLL